MRGNGRIAINSVLCCCVCLCVCPSITLNQIKSIKIKSSLISLAIPISTLRIKYEEWFY